MTDDLAGRAEIIATLRSELVGPCPAGTPLDFSVPVSFATAKESYGPWVQAASGEEVLQRDRPVKRYGIGVLYPPRVPIPDEEQDGGSHPGDTADGAATLLADSAAEDIEAVAERRGRVSPAEGGADDFDLSSANDYRPSTMALTFLADLPDGSALKLSGSGGRYTEVTVMVEGAKRVWWLRSPVTFQAEFSRSELLAPKAKTVRPADWSIDGGEGLKLEARAYSRPWGEHRRLITLSLENTASPPAAPDGWCLFQAAFRVAVSAPGEERLIAPYPKRDGDRLRAEDLEEASFDLLYRHARTFAIGHGCAADWAIPIADRCAWVAAEPMPAVETPSITPEIRRPDGTELAVPMGPLAGLDPANDGMAGLAEVLDLYREWIRDREAEMGASLEPEHRPAAGRHLDACHRALARMEEGIRLIQDDPVAARAFRLANQAVLLQQLRSRTQPRTTVLDGKTARFAIREPLDVPDWRAAMGRGSWRPFQIAFILTTLCSVANSRHAERDTTDLLFFPTGGGKTEAYLGVSAFAMFHRRLRNPEDTGVEVLMRYTLRLLTAQQFQRAAALICAMEQIRSAEPDLGDTPFSIGVWLGNQATPGSNAEARAALKKLNSGEKYAENPFVLLRCPWCSAQMGPVATEGRAAKGSPKVAGYVETAGRVAFVCPDITCEFRKGLPVYVTDEDVYERRPSMVIGTVDKFAMLAWRPEARALFGIGPAGAHTASPPGTIIQDELHLISGPLGSVVGLYEAVIEELCTDRRSGDPVRPKIISSTATIRRYEQQVKGLFNRNDAVVFPPRGLDASDSFFARYAREDDGRLKPGRIYVGVHGGGLGSVQTAQVRTFSALLQAPMPMDGAHSDPWWTLMIFFNSLRELGTSLSLLQSDIPDYLGAIRNRLGLDPEKKEVRYLRHVKELTGRLRSDEIPRAIDDLSRRATDDDPVDVCLASNIIEVGIDIDRLSLMAVVGQPKTTSQYIQVTGRVGRRWWERPGLVVTIFSPSKPRDRSHFEKFRSYHERLYAQVEPTSVTPFSPPVLDRALHAVLCAYIRQKGNEQLTPWPLPERLASEALDLFLSRAEGVDPAEVPYLKEVFTRRVLEWKGWEPVAWSMGSWQEEQLPLMRMAGEWAPPAAARMTWPTPTSMRNVDAECMAEVTLRYAQEKGESDV